METTHEESNCDLLQDPQDVVSLFDRKRLIQQALDACAFPPQLCYPEIKCVDSNLMSLFSQPVLVWVPEARNRTKKPFCVVPECKCESRVKERMLRVVEDVDCKYNVLYVKYQCSEKQTSGTSTTFSTLSSAFIERNPDSMVHLPFVLSKKMGFTKRLMEHVHEGILSPNGLSSALNHLERRRRNRYYSLLSQFVYAVNRKHNENPHYQAPSPPTADGYLARNNVVSHGSLTAAWITYTALYSSLCELVMKQAGRANHSCEILQAIEKLERTWAARKSSGRKNAAVQNEIGQIVGRRLTSSENKEETMQLLSDVKSQFKPVGECYLVSDNASAVHDFVADVYGNSVVVKPDPFYVMQRFSEKVKQKTIGKRLRKELSDAFMMLTEN